MSHYFEPAPAGLTTRSLFLVAGAFAIGDGAPVYRGDNSIVSCWRLVDGATNGVSTQFTVPKDWASGALTFFAYLYNVGATNGNIRLNMREASVSAGSVLAAAVATAQTVIMNDPVSLQLVIAQLTQTITPTAGQLIACELQRVGADVLDTLTNDAGFLGLRVDYTSSS